MSLLATTFFLLSVVLMTKGEDAMAQNLDRPALSEELYLFDVYSDACVDRIKASLDMQGVTVLHSFKEVAVRHYYFVVVSPGVEVSRKLDFPEGSRVTSLPLEHISDYYDMFGVGNWTYADTEDALPDDVLHVDEWEFLFPKNTSTADFMSMMTAYARQYTDLQGVARSMAYATPARYPPRAFFFVKMEINVLQYVVRDGLDAVGGPANAKVTIRHLVKI